MRPSVQCGNIVDLQIYAGMVRKLIMTFLGPSCLVQWPNTDFLFLKYSLKAIQAVLNMLTNKQKRHCPLPQSREALAETRLQRGEWWDHA